MPARGWELRLRDILAAITKIQRYTISLTKDQFVSDEMVVDAVIRNITVIGEAASLVPDDIAARCPDLPWAEMRGIRNVVVHEYFGVSLDILWETVQQDLPPLVSQLEQILANEE